MELAFSEIDESDIGALTAAMTRAFDDDARKHLGEEKGGPEGYDDGEFFRTWLFGQEWTDGYKVTSGSAVVGGVIVWVFGSGENLLGTIFIDPRYQDQGVGARLWNFVEARYPRARSWRLETPGFAKKNHRFYEKCGFERIEVKPPAGDMPHESWVYLKAMDCT